MPLHYTTIKETSLKICVIFMSLNNTVAALHYWALRANTLTHTHHLWQDTHGKEQTDSLHVFFFFSSFSSLFISKECKYNVQQRHSTKQWRAEEVELLWRRRKRRRRRALYRKETARFTKQPEVVQSDFSTRCLSCGQMAAINHSLVITCQTSTGKPFLVWGR